MKGTEELLARVSELKARSEKLQKRCEAESEVFFAVMERNERALFEAQHVSKQNAVWKEHVLSGVLYELFEAPSARFRASPARQAIVRKSPARPDSEDGGDE